MSVTKKPSCMVKPAEPTWSELDQTGSTTHVPTIYIYKQPSDNWETVVQTLKTSLSHTLVHFYPLAARLASIEGGRMELNCNAAGVQFTEAYADMKVLDLGDFLPSPIFEHLIPSIDYRHAPLEEIPIVQVQVTRFTCGGYSLGINISHVVTDGQSALHFVYEWARICRGEPLGTPPYLDKSVLRAGDPPSRTSSGMDEHVSANPPPIIIGQSGDENESKNETTVTMLKLTKTQVEKLREKANETLNSKMDHGYSRFEVVAAHTWRTTCKARSLEPQQLTRLAMGVDVRSRMKPPLPNKYFGNAVVLALATQTSDEMVSKPLGYVSSKIREAVEKVNDEYVNSKIEFLKNQEDLSKFRDLTTIRNGQSSFYGNPNLGVISWLTLPTYSVDFGWGKEIHMGPAGTNYSDGQFFLLSGKDGDGSLFVAAWLQVRHMEDFKVVFYQSIDME